MAEAEREEFALRGYVLEAVRENQDWFVLYPQTGSYIGKVLVRPHNPKGPFIAYYGSTQISDSHPNLEDAVDAVARRLAQRNGAA